MNKTLKYNYLPRGKNITVSQLVSTLIEQFLPEMFHKYQKQNFAMSESYRSYSKHVPEYLRGRPRSVILHCLSRIKKAAKFKKGSVQQTGEGSIFLVNSPSGTQHKVKISNDSDPECSCKDWVCWHLPCKHMFAVFNYTPLNWFDFPDSYRQNEYLCADAEALASSVVSDEFHDHDDDNDDDEDQSNGGHNGEDEACIVNGESNDVNNDSPLDTADTENSRQDLGIKQCSHELPKHMVCKFCI